MVKSVEIRSISSTDHLEIPGDLLIIPSTPLHDMPINDVQKSSLKNSEEVPTFTLIEPHADIALLPPSLWIKLKRPP